MLNLPVHIVRKMNGARQAVSLTRYMNITCNHCNDIYVNLNYSKQHI